jgi:enoyl-CoA hydratase
METLLFEKKGHIGYLTFNRPKALNALNTTVLSELKTLLGELKDDAELRCLIVTGSGEKAFVAGADIKQMTGLNTDEATEFAKAGQEAFNALEALPVPVIAAVNGFALGGGLELAISCDIILASEKAKFGLPEVTLGLFPAFGGTQRLARSIGLFKAREMIYTGDFYSAADGAAMGFVNHVVAPEALMETAEKMAGTIAKRGPIAVAEAKSVMNDGFDRLLSEGLDMEAGRFGKLFATEDAKEGTTAFVEKRPANFQGK